MKARNKNTGEQYEHNYYNGIQEEELGNFNNEYSDFRKKLGIDDYLQKKNYLNDAQRNNINKNVYELPDGDNGSYKRKKY